jgi:iron complex transport system substrate-binding protein
MKYRSFIILVLFFTFLKNSYAQVPQRIVSLAPSITESLYSLGVEDKIVGVTTYCPSYLGNEKEKIGTLLEPNLEKIVSLSPDLVLATAQGNRAQTIAKLRSLRLKVFVLKESKNFSEICQNFLKLAKLVGKTEEAEKIITEVKGKISLIKKRLKGEPRVRVFWEVGSSPLVTIGKQSFVNELIDFAGGANIFTDLQAPYSIVSKEEVVRRNPEVIILVTMGYVTTKEARFWSKFNIVKAVKNKRIYVIDAYKVSQPTPWTFVTGLEELTWSLHPQIFK